MKRLFLLSVFAALMLAMFSCNEMNDNNGKTLILKDSLVNVLPTYEAVHIKVNDDHDFMLIVVGDVTFYKASPEEKTRKAEEVGKMVLRIYGKDNYLKKGSLIVTKDNRNTSDNPADGISTPIDFEALKKVVYPK